MAATDDEVARFAGAIAELSLNEVIFYTGACGEARNKFLTEPKLAELFNILASIGSEREAELRRANA